jgi:hypothetical protein
MRPKQDRLQSPLAAVAHAEDVSRRVDTRIEPCLSHQFHRVLSPCDIGIGISNPAHAISERSARRSTEDTQRFQAML